MKRITAIAATVIGSAAILLGGTACNKSDADVASHNLSKAADNFEVVRRIVFFNGITDKYLLSLEGKCSLGNNDAPGQLTVTCYTGKDESGDSLYKKHFLGLSDNVSYFVEQLDAKNVSVDHYRVVFNPSQIIPDIDLR